MAIVASGGGMTCSYSVGTLLALIDKYDLTSPEIAIGASGGAGTLAYYVSGQYKSIRNIWGNLLSTKKFINPMRIWRVIDIDYVIDQVFKKQEPLLIEKIHNSHIHFLIPRTNIQTGKVEYFSNRSSENVFEALRATKAMPFVYGKAVKINESKYCDTYLSASVMFNVKKAKSLGAERILVLDNSLPDSLIGNGMDLWVKLRSRDFRKNYYSELKKISKIQSDDTVLYLKPKKRLKISTLDNNGLLLKETIETGYNETINNKKLEVFLGKLR